MKCQLSSYFKGGKRFNMTAKDMSKGLKDAGRELDYPTVHNISIQWIDIHLLRSGVDNTLSLLG